MFFLFINFQNSNLQKLRCNMLAKDVGFETLLQSVDKINFKFQLLICHLKLETSTQNM